ILVREPVCPVGRGAQTRIPLPTVDTVKTIIHRPEDYEIGDWVFQGLRENAGLGDEIVRGDVRGALDLLMSRIPKIRLIVQTRKGGVSWTSTEDVRASEFLIQCPGELVHVNIGVEFRGIKGEGNAGGSALFVHYGLETSQVGEGGRHWSVLVRGHVALELERHQTRQACRSEEHT